MNAVVEEMNKVVPMTPPKAKAGWGRKLWRGFLVLLALLAAFLLAAQLRYTYSGAHKWEFVTERDGVKVYAMKVPGKNLKKYMAVFRLKASLSAITAFMQDNDSEIDLGIYGAKELERRGPQHSVTVWKTHFDKPFMDREFIAQHIWTQDPATRNVSYALQALPDYLPADDCCVRVPRMDNSWMLVPQKNGEVEVRWFIDMEIGGAAPWFLANEVFPDMMPDFGSKMQGYVNRAEYVNAKLAWITEPAP